MSSSEVVKPPEQPEEEQVTPNEVDNNVVEAPAEPELEKVQLENNDFYYQGEVIAGTNTKHGEGVLIDKENMLQYTGTFVNDLKSGETCTLKCLDNYHEIVEYTGGFKEEKIVGIGMILFRSGYLFKGEFKNGLPSDGIMKYPNGDEYSGPLSVPGMQKEGHGILIYKNGD